jgi:hypothetical protein
MAGRVRARVYHKDKESKAMTIGCSPVGSAFFVLFAIGFFSAMSPEQVAESLLNGAIGSGVFGAFYLLLSGAARIKGAYDRGDLPGQGPRKG